MARFLLFLTALLCFIGVPGRATGASSATGASGASTQPATTLERTLLFLSPAGALQMANISPTGTRIPRAALAPGMKARRFCVSPDGSAALLETADAKGVVSTWVLDLSARRAKLLGRGLLLPTHQASPFAPDGRRVALRRQNRDEVAVLSANTGQVLHTLSTPGIQESPAWLGDARHVAVPTQLPNGRSAIAIWDAVSGSLRREALKDPTRVRFRCETVTAGQLIYRETREGVDRWLAVAAGAEQVVDQPPAPSLPVDLPRGADASLCPDGPWLAYVHAGALYVRYSDDGAEPVKVGPALTCRWKPGAPLPERVVVSQAEPSMGNIAPAVIPGVLSLETDTPEAIEGDTLGIAWEPGPEVAWVRLSVLIERAPKGGAKRGTYAVPIAKVPASRKAYEWKVPWVDNITFVLRAEPMDAAHKALGKAERVLSFRPRELAAEERDGIFVHLSERERQRLYVQEGGRLTASYLCSGASTHRTMPHNQHPDDPHDHYGTFRVRVKDIDHVSNIDTEWKMPYAMGYLTGHYIHQTARNQYHKLGRPASHGCVRLHGNDASRLFKKTPVGELVVIY